MSAQAKRRRRIVPLRAPVAATVVALALPGVSLLPGAWTPTANAAAPGLHSSAFTMMQYDGLQIAVPRSWRVVDLEADIHACVRYDVPSLYLGATGDQADCPAHLVGGASTLQLQPLTPELLGAPSVIVVPTGGDVGDAQIPAAGPAQVAVEDAGVLLTAVYGPGHAGLIHNLLASVSLTPDATPMSDGAGAAKQAAPSRPLTAPGTYRGRGFDTCGAPSSSVMDAWRATTDYRGIGVYIGGMSRGCSQPNLTATWVAEQISEGWHLIPTYVGRQAPCSGFRNRVSYDPGTALEQGREEGVDAVAQAQALGLAAPSTIYFDMEGYDSSDDRCVAAVLTYLSAWTNTLHTYGYQSGVYSSAASGIHDLSTHYYSRDYVRPDDVWIAWWNGQADVDGGPYVPDTHWSVHRRVHQYAGNTSETHGGYRILIDRNYLDLSWVVPPPPGCPTNLDFWGYRPIGPGAEGDDVRAAQCLLARSGFDPGIGSGKFGWRTAAAVRAFKVSRGLSGGDAVLRRWAWSALSSAGPTQFLHDGVRGLRVSKVQRALTARLGRHVPITGYYGPVIRRAVREYQAMQGMTVTGTVGVPTWRALQSGL